MITITSKRAGFRRCGIAHPAEPTSYPDRRFNAAELERLQAEPMLGVIVEHDRAPAPKRRKDSTAKRKAAPKKPAGLPS
jgi:hypothetical protein